MLDVLYELVKSKECAVLYSNPETDKFKFGYVLAANENEIALQELSPNGTDDGIVVMDSNRIFRVEKDSQYVDKMMKLCLGVPPQNWLGPIDENNILISILSKSILKDKIISIELLDSGYYATSGFVDQIQNHQCAIRQVDEYGFEDGVSYFSISDITELAISSEFEKRIERLWKINRKT